MNYIERVAAVLQCVASSSSGARVSELAAQLEIPKSGVFRVMSDLESVGLIRTEGDALRVPGELLIDLAHSTLGTLNFHAIAEEHLKWLSLKTNETVTFSRLVGYQREYLLQIESSELVRMSVPLGVGLPLHSGASGQALLSGLGDQQFEQYLRTAELSKVTKNTITDAKKLHERIQNVKDVGYSYSQGERDPLASSIATPVIRNGYLIGAISICGPLPRLSHDKAVEFLPSLLSTADSLGNLGFKPSQSE